MRGEILERKEGFFSDMEAECVLESIVVSGIEVDIFKSSSDPKIGVFLLHGRTSKRHDLKSIAQGIVKRGSHIVVFSIDQRNHGSRLVDKLRNETWSNGNPTHHLDMWSIQLGTMKDVEFLIEMFPLYGYALKEWGVCGISLGGHVSLLLAGYCDKIKYCVSVIGSLDFMTLINGRRPEDVTFSNEFIQLVDKYNAIKTLRNSKCDILMLNGSLDELVPRYSNIQHDLIPGLVYKEFEIGHAVNSEMIETIYTYFEKNN